VRQILYTITKNYQDFGWGREELGMGKKAPMVIVDYQTDLQRQEAFRKRYAFVDWSKAEVHFDGFTSTTIKKI